jgi:hypothetical protein
VLTHLNQAAKVSAIIALRYGDTSAYAHGNLANVLAVMITNVKLSLDCAMRNWYLDDYA